ncbi:MAG TPA: tRNA uridine-5-carboxymethylaminomethyl(34) synthesis GTPase MnmE [Thermoanaerobaculia bacterium]|nr:tRNA uridine-5-carboxymethylaminomethyl(34) synthesis GTPase MnmE [Thermoanaerobaculia bacterium]
MNHDTIVAPATPLGRSALAIVRIDGRDCSSILAQLSRAGVPAVRMAAFVRLFSVVGSRLSEPFGDAAQSGTLLDECIAIRYEAPHSFTGNDLVELTLHGNPLIVEQVIAACVALGARMAEPGEFTERAVLNGKMDLVQAESIADLINARTALQAKLSLSNLEGMLSRTAASIRQTLLEVISRLEAALDFSEEGYEFITRDEVRTRLEEALRQLSSMSETYRRGRATTSGLNAVILGRPNAGKSTLLNRLVGSDRAIVTAIPGTTRDIVRETIEIGGLPVTLADTAGLRESSDVVEGIGIERARQAALSADIVLYLIDASAGVTDEDRRELASLENVEVVFTKRDLTPASDVSHEKRGLTPSSDDSSLLSISVVSEEGVDRLLLRLDELVRERFVAHEGALVNERQRIAVTESAAALQCAIDSSVSGLDEQMVLVDLYRSANSLALLTGAITRDDVMAEIFGKFCIGK